MNKYVTPFALNDIPAVIAVSRVANITIATLCLFAIYCLLAI